MRQEWKADEMEMSINFTAARNAFVFAEIALLVDCFYQVMKDGNFAVPLFILAAAGCVFWGTKQFVTRSMSKAGDEDEE